MPHDAAALVSANADDRALGKAMAAAKLEEMEAKMAEMQRARDALLQIVTSSHDGPTRTTSVTL